jgi:hypothetical protein
MLSKNKREITETKNRIRIKSAENLITILPNWQQALLGGLAGERR